MSDSDTPKTDALTKPETTSDNPEVDAVNETDNSMRIDASPTKEFFITMLVKDIPLIRSILDLIDNSVDGAIRIRKDRNFKDLWVRLEEDADKFIIADNCGGIPVDIARDYAFRFGRPKDMPATEHSIGQFGVGMKRALFKLGRFFTVESTSERGRFVVEIDVDDWQLKKSWDFEFKELEEKTDKDIFPVSERGTKITATRLHGTVSEVFVLQNFQTRLTDEMAAAVNQVMQEGLAITLNKIPLQYQPSQLLASDLIQPAYRQLVFEEAEPKAVTAKIYTGISDSSPTKAGWYIFCNGRMVLEADRSSTTGWGVNEDTSIPKIHNQFARFRGYVYFDCDDASRLPWNTTKTGVDVDSPIFRAARQEMLLMMRPVIDFLNKLKDEEQLEEKPLSAAIQMAGKVDVLKVTGKNVFTSPNPTKKAPRSNTIQYSKPLEQIDKVKQVSGARSLKEVGERTFEYFFERECED